MRTPFAAILVCPLLLAGSAGQAADDTARALSALNERLREVQVEVRTRQTDAVQRLETLDLLLDGIETISLEGGTLRLAAARRKLDEARERAGQPSAAGSPVPAVLDALGTLLERPPFGVTPERLRGLAADTLMPLEESLVEVEEGLVRDSAFATSVRENLVQVEAGLRASWQSAVRVSVETRRASLGLPLAMKAPQQWRPGGSRTPHIPVDLRDAVRVYQDDAQRRQLDLARRVDVLLLLTVGGASIPPKGNLLPTAAAREMLAEARARADRPLPLDGPVPSVLTRAGALLDLLASGAPPPQGRAAYFLTVTPLEEQVLELAEGLRAEAATVGGIAAILMQTDEGILRPAALEALRSSIRARRAAGGLLSPRRQGDPASRADPGRTH